MPVISLLHCFVRKNISKEMQPISFFVPVTFPFIRQPRAFGKPYRLHTYTRCIMCHAASRSTYSRGSLSRCPSCCRDSRCCRYDQYRSYLSFSGSLGHRCHPSFTRLVRPFEPPCRTRVDGLRFSRTLDMASPSRIFAA